MCLMAHLRMRISADNAYSFFCYFITIPVRKEYQTEEDETLFCYRQILEILSFSLDEVMRANTLLLDHFNF